MPFDPTKPAAGSPLSSAELRAQLTALKALIDALTATVAAQASTIATQNAAITDLTARVTALENLPVGGITQADLDAAIATRAPKPTAINPLPYGASPTYEQSEAQGGFDLMANLITTLNA